MNSKINNYLLIGILALGLFLRIQGIDFGLPFVYDEDESRRVDQAFQMLLNRDPNPRWFGHPASTLIYLLAANQLLMFWGGELLGFFSSFSDFQDLYYNNPTLFYLMGRIWLIVFGTATIWITYLIGKELENKNIGLIAAFLVAINTLQIKYAKIIRSDILMTFFLLLAFFYCLKILDDKNTKNYILTGAFLGLAIVTKYPAVIFVFTLILGHFISNEWSGNNFKKLGYSAISCLLACFLAAPFLFINAGVALQDISGEARSSNVGANAEGFISNLFWYWHNPLAYALTHFGLAVILIGLVFCIIYRDKKQILLVTFLITFYLFIASGSLRWDRWVIPLLPFACLLIASTLNKVSQLLPLKLGFLVVVICLGLILRPTMYANYVEIQELLGDDTRTITREWILENIPPGSSILVDEGTPPLPADLFQLYEVNNQTLTLIHPEDSRHVFVGVEIKPIGKLEKIEEVEEQNIQYVILSWKYRQYLDERDRYPEIVATYEQIISSATLIHKMERNRERNITSGPKIKVYQLPGISRI
ncbi:glycosyltransferase family 39 protein [Gloeocapsa sp. PCC 73106]|uniref:ArnT family glycosyltransferase n=1 Tax=Gloeocapsa sp. PCC 73106 TaxID=102232 RepID=UPI0002AC4C97|nr:glycosyltransferase family 39 protein [Gloeocapsa sp. PCC 73106]ELR99741.1 PMT family glycosyltransferase, 4-amino-4-deoxy-L-arabinose transferase [Gloeocapsa sp. PCC 73106]